MKRILVSALFLSLIFCAFPALADEVIYGGIDLWKTPAVGTYTDFAKEPIPSGFFCNGSRAFTGRIDFKGVPLVTGEPGVLGATDTIVQRLDNAPFGENGVAVTRVQVRALQFESVAPVKTACGSYDVRVTLNGRQPITRMQIFRENDEGGRFLAPIAVNIKMTFTPVDRKAANPLALTRSLRFNPDPRAAWAVNFNKRAPQRTGWTQVDTNADGVADTYLPGTSNFAAGFKGSADKDSEPMVINHLQYQHAHATEPLLLEPIAY